MRMRQALRSIGIWSGIAGVTLTMYAVGLPLFVVSRPFDRQRAIGHWYASRWARINARLNRRWSWEVRGAERIPRGRPLVVVANHQGMGDILMAFHLDLHFKWISKSTVFWVPFMGWFMYHAGYIPLERGKKSSIVRCMERARTYLENGVSVLFFPEGTRSRDGKVGPFKPGAFRLALDGGFDILPIAISGTADALPKDTWRFSDTASPMSCLIGEVISTRGLGEPDLERLIARTRSTVVALLNQLEGRIEPVRLRASA